MKVSPFDRIKVKLLDKPNTQEVSQLYPNFYLGVLLSVVNISNTVSALSWFIGILNKEYL